MKRSRASDSLASKMAQPPFQQMDGEKSHSRQVTVFGAVMKSKAERGMDQNKGSQKENTKIGIPKREFWTVSTSPVKCQGSQ